MKKSGGGPYLDRYKHQQIRSQKQYKLGLLVIATKGFPVRHAPPTPVTALFK